MLVFGIWFVWFFGFVYTFFYCFAENFSYKKRYRNYKYKN